MADKNSLRVRSNDEFAAAAVREVVKQVQRYRVSNFIAWALIRESYRFER